MAIPTEVNPHIGDSQITIVMVENKVEHFSYLS